MRLTLGRTTFQGADHSQSKATPGPSLSLSKIEMIDPGGRLAHAGSDARVEVGEALHRFFAADDPAIPLDGRLAIASHLNNTRASGLYPKDFVIATDRLWRFLEVGFGPGAALLPEWPIRRRGGNGQEVHGRIDLLIRYNDALSILDHKSFPGQNPDAKATEYLPQLSLTTEMAWDARPLSRSRILSYTCQS
jgi:hypothetical protein